MIRHHIGRRAMLAGASLALTAQATEGQAQNTAATWPQRPVRVILPYPPGGGTDVLARALVEAMRPNLAQPIIVENRPGAQGVIGSEAVARAEPDGSTFAVVTSTHNLNKYQLAQIPYDPVKDFTPVAILSRQILVLVAARNQPFEDVAGLVRYARANPGKVGFGATEALTAFAGHEFNRRAGVRTEEVQYRGGGLLMNDIVAGHLPIGWTSTASALPHLSTNQVRVLAVSTAERTRLMPDVPTVREGGVADYDVSGWVAALAPPRMQPALLREVHAAIARAYAEPALMERFRTLGLEPNLLDPEQTAAFLRSDDARWAAAAAEGQIVKQ
ncbi:Bug family tripartite tricarboxylate transporter substrate binding protein [Roseomonas xinghualingensis]|uniref:Bug family tripartite tricarboxylate transporter substrate binding protein n=1 Tax=Roseomonas xinghualingensis TaxID=2986475 RepID=UPI0021F0C701|nr:tripartite tricarboxylate transporter substrate binding protein [Roseomonas sp. SXEYE001]MCV4206309.1 tripartite tricarboxylate transporter substrate binding protein [Roseomonas sp. SXEYE001]